MGETLAVTSGSTAPLHETTRRNAPFGKKQLLYTGLFLNVFGVVLMAALSWRRLGKPVRIWGIVALAAIFLVLNDLIATVVSAVQPSPSLSLSCAVSWILILVTAVIPGIIFALLAARLQQREYSAWVAEHGQREPLIRERGGWPTLLVIVVASFGLGFFYARSISPLIVGQIMLPAVSELATDSVFSDPAFELTYPFRWKPADSSLNSSMDCGSLECALWLMRTDARAGLVVMRSEQSLDRTVSLEDIAELAWVNVPSTSSTELVQEPVAVEVSGQPAQQAMFSSGHFVTLVTITTHPNGSLFAISTYTRANASADELADVLADAEAIISSIQFK